MKKLEKPTRSLHFIKVASDSVSVTMGVDANRPTYQDASGVERQSQPRNLTISRANLLNTAEGADLDLMPVLPNAFTTDSADDEVIKAVATIRAVVR